MHTFFLVLILCMTPATALAQSEGLGQFVTSLMLALAAVGVLLAIGVATLIGVLISRPRTPPSRPPVADLPSIASPPPSQDTPKEFAQTPPPSNTIPEVFPQALPPTKTPSTSTNPAVPAAAVLAIVIFLGYFLSHFSPSPLQQMLFMGVSGGFMYALPLVLLIALVIAGLTLAKKQQTNLSEQQERARLEPPTLDQAIPHAPGNISADDAERMAGLSISFDGNQFVYSGNRYDRLQDAIAYAELERSRPK